MPLLSNSKYESDTYKLPKWKESFIEAFISLFRLDMDRIRAGPIAGSKYYAMCKIQGLHYRNEKLSSTAKFYYETLGLPNTFSTWYQITLLHEWMLFVRMRAMPGKYGQNYQQKIVDRTFQDIELRLSEEMNIHSGRIRDRYLKEFDNQLRGAILSYDEAFVSDDITLAYALWRNLFNAKQDVDYLHLEALVRYIRMNLYVLSKLSDREFGFGNFTFVAPNEVVKLLTPKEEIELRKTAHKLFEPKNGKILPSQRSKLSLDN
ncbi:Cbp3p ASCRUDRAFT_73556 [Ascoidea rubescens DSM 1968]|uniref:Ubiquinol-cytochrome c chaperone domain-containing protein n=1 Tax=Ascoidea rubescens DSM 1968 TaxID=1344418 RepID=A0A1D2VQA7_9ASCO|nr:hypothetical protein ASCRUDRAFT_73556 [Ascoidea rubescens DSM 1968]ODV63774.1 hypothetical protein ASCRUDRAFT_73556 [Ascoidea rubescens DSM 1968]